MLTPISLQRFATYRCDLGINSAYPILDRDPTMTGVLFAVSTRPRPNSCENDSRDSGEDVFVRCHTNRPRGRYFHRPRVPLC
jgi:hypothetical protein